ncbi:amidohydrolase family protein [Brevibacterium sp. BRM-1]|uniref:amidohydrolase family protein n=1 Tax=Brevibacterium sp. BRM-1 TaxID=2999062 RepID=UPI002282173F|nr:amidohydrolase family protein [Brevibacterium sp. BRM-1]WAL39827.1 amidohydrolase family protein [Brevibacterium sp. BRM-1]
MPSATPPDDEPQRIRALTESLGLPGLIDVHTHFMPQRVLAKVWDYFDSAGPLIGRAWPIAYRLPEDGRVAALRGFGLRAFTSLNYAHRPGMAAWLNDWSRGFAARVPECALSATFYPEESAPEYVAQALAAGTRIFKVHVQVGAFDPLDERLAAVWGLVEDAQVPVVIHVGSGPRPGEFTGPRGPAELLRRHPRLRLVFAHMGMPEYAEFLALAEAHESVGLDTTMVFTDFVEAADPYPRELLPRLAQLRERVVLGTDFPNIPYPYLHQLEALESLGLGADWLRAVLHDNGARLLGLSESA